MTSTYLEAAHGVGQWLLSVAERDAHGWSWPGQPGHGSDVGPGIGWGTAAPTLFFVEAYRTTGDERYLQGALEGARWMSSALEEVAASWAGCGLFTGIGGWAFVLDELADASGDESARELARRVLERVAKSAERDGHKVNFHGLTEILWGNAGIGCLLLCLGERYLGAEALELATGAGDWLLDQAEPTGTGLCWSLGPGFEERRPGDRRRFPNFAHGAAGIAFFLARLSRVTGEQRFLDASLAATAWVLSSARTEDDTCAAFHHSPDATELFTLGWCHGPPGLGWLFRELEVTTGSPSWRAWLRRAARADRLSGIPTQRSPGFWDNVARCCGSAGVAEFFLDLHRLEHEDDDLAFAITLVEDLLERAIRDEAGVRWSNVEYRLEAPNLPPETTYLQGAPGIGSTLLRLHRHLAGDEWTLAWPHAPSWQDERSVASD